MHLTLAGTLLVLLMIGCSPDANRPDPASVPAITPEMVHATEHISAPQIRSVIAEIASDAYQGRAPGTGGDRMTRSYLAGRLEAAGLQPGAAGDWQQRFDLVGLTARQPATWNFGSGKQAVSFQRGSDFIVFSGAQEPRLQITDAELVFVGYGIQAPEYQWDDFAGRNLKGKVLIVLNDDPHWDPELFEGRRRLYYGRWIYKYDMAAAQGAAGAIIVHTDRSAGYPWSAVKSSFSGTKFELPQGSSQNGGGAHLQVKAWMTRAAVERLMTSAGYALDELIQKARHREFVPVPLGITTSIEFPNEITTVRTGNVLGRLPGSDPELRDELIVYTAHHDHLGMDPLRDGDQIYNGALDNASGTALVVAIAEAFAALPTAPRRSVLFALVGAEEQGLLGSQYLAENPPVHPGRIAANINYDVANNNGRTSDVIFIGKGKSSLDQVAQQVADFQGRTLKPDQDPDKGFFYRSDQINLARIGVPALYVKGGRDVIGQEGLGDDHAARYIANRYHRPNDELTSDWSFDGMVDDARFGLLAGLLIANADAMPTWNPGDEFEAVRLRALSEAADPAR